MQPIWQVTNRGNAIQGGGGWNDFGEMDLHRRQQGFNEEMGRGNLGLGWAGQNLAGQRENFAEGMANRKWDLLKGELGKGGYPYQAATGIGTGPIWSQDQIQQQVNAGRAQNDAATQNRIQGVQQSMQGRGFGANSPLSQALQAQYQGQNLATGSDLERQMRWGAAQGNAQYSQAGQIANAQQQTQRMGYARQQNQSLLAALAGI